jgi:hypothetical protein
MQRWCSGGKSISSPKTGSQPYRLIQLVEVLDAIIFIHGLPLAINRQA